MLTNEEKNVVRRFAEGDKTARVDAEKIYMACIQDHKLSGYRSDEMNFLSEVLKPFPDYMMISFYRNKVLES